jgi:DNA modification methylase
LTIDLRQGDCLDVMRTMPDRSVHTCVTSPPYFGLRDYGTGRWVKAVATSTLGGGKKTTGHLQEGYKDQCPRCGARRVDPQIGLEATPDAFVAKMVEVFREVYRVLRDDGTCWLNLGDSYSAQGKSVRPEGGGGLKDTPRFRVSSTPGFAPKQLIGIPWRVAFALQADGWYLRSDIIWHKPNPMPESVRDRPTKAHEYLFLLSKSERYFYDADAVAEPATQPVGTPKETGQHKNYILGHCNGKSGYLGSNQGKPTRNRRSVWTVATRPFKGAHFATFPPKLIEPCILAGTSEAGCCPECGTPWERVVERTNTRRPSLPKTWIGASQQRSKDCPGPGNSSAAPAKPSASAPPVPATRATPSPAPCSTRSTAPARRASWPSSTGGATSASS